MRIIVTLLMLSIFLPVPVIAAQSRSLATVEKAIMDGRYAAAESDADSLIKSGYSRKDELYYYKGLAELKMNRFQDARSSFSYIVARYPHSERAFDANLGLGDSHLLEGDHIKALGIYADMESRFGSNENIAIVYSRLGTCYERMGMRAKVERYQGMVKAKAPHSFESRSSVTQSAKTAPRPAARAETVKSLIAPAAISEAGRYSVQVGSFKDKKNADRMSRKLSAAGYNGYVERYELGGDSIYRVRAGSFHSKDQALSLSTRLKKDGYRTHICSGDSCE